MLLYVLLGWHMWWRLFVKRSEHFIRIYLCHAMRILFVFNGHVFMRVLSIRVCMCMCVLTYVSIN